MVCRGRDRNRRPWNIVGVGLAQVFRVDATPLDDEGAAGAEMSDGEDDEDDILSPERCQGVSVSSIREVGSGHDLPDAVSPLWLAERAGRKRTRGRDDDG